MKEVVFSKNAWGYRFLCFMNSNYKHSRRPQDVCAYGRALLWQLIRALFFVSIACLFSLAMGIMTLEKILCLVYEPSCQVLTWSKWAQVLVMIPVGFITVICLMTVTGLFVALAFYTGGAFNACIRQLIKLTSGPDIPVEKQNTVVRAYKAWKEKSCFKIKFD